MSRLMAEDLAEIRERCSLVDGGSTAVLSYIGMLLAEVEELAKERDEARAICKYGWEHDKPMKPYTQWENVPTLDARELSDAALKDAEQRGYARGLVDLIDILDAAYEKFNTLLEPLNAAGILPLKKDGGES